jgi:hypothetical protein
MPVEMMLATDIGQARLLIHDMGKDLTIIKAAEAPKVFELKRALGEEMLVKLVCVVIKSFCESIKASKTMDSIDIIECAEDLIATYTHDSVKDFIMALKNARKEGMKFYNCLSHGIVMGIISEYMANKADALEGLHRDTKSKNDGSTRTEANTLAISQENRYKKEKEIYEQKEATRISDEVRKLEAVKKLIDKSLNSKID